MSSNSLRSFTSESVTEGHPDKVCDRISDAILDAILAQDKNAHVAIETMITKGLVHVAGEVTTEAYVEIPDIVRREIVDVGYTSSEVCFDGNSCGVSVSIGRQSPDISAGVNTALEARDTTDTVDAFDMHGAGDQGIMFGYACDETPCGGSQRILSPQVWQNDASFKSLTQLVQPSQLDCMLRPSAQRIYPYLKSSTR